MIQPDLSVRIVHTINVVVPLVFFMASIYLWLHVLFARFITRPDSPVLWFFAVVTGPLTRPVRAVLPAGTPERRVRLVSLGVYVALWLASRILLAGWLGSAVR
ncbi:MAG TPA: hypothetical protein VHO73_05320 [Methylomirabilota bacterium]|nr:hypothetical protein [Methylomirabilota bacterium]